MNVVLDFLDIWFADKKSLHSSSLRYCCFSQNTHVSHDQCGPFPNHSTTGSVKYHVTDNFAVFLATEFTLQNSRVVTREDRKIARWLASFRATSLAVFCMRFCVHIENTATKNLKVWNTAVFVRMALQWAPCMFAWQGTQTRALPLFPL